MSSFWARLTEAERDALRSVSFPVRYRTDQLIMRQGETERYLLVILAGSTKVIKIIEQGIEKVLALCGPGSLLGELSALTSAARSATVVALEPVYGLRIDVGSFADVTRKFPGLRRQLELVLAERLLQADERRVEGAMPRAFPRLASLLAGLAERFAGEGQHAVVLPISQLELASLASTSVATVSRFVGRLKQLGILRTGRRRIIILDAGELRRLAEGDR